MTQLASGHTPFLVVVLGGPGSGKSSLGEAIHKAFPGLSPVSGGDLARLATSDGATALSPKLATIARQLADRKYPKHAAEQLNKVVLEALAAGVHSCPGTVGFVVDGVRASDLGRFEAALGTTVSCVLWIECPREVMISRQRLRGNRVGDERLGFVDAGDTQKRIDAYLKREDAEAQTLRTHFQSLHDAVVVRIDGTAPLDDVSSAACSALVQAAASGGPDREASLDAARRAEPGLHIDWFRVLTSLGQAAPATPSPPPPAAEASAP